MPLAVIVLLISLGGGDVVLEMSAAVVLTGLTVVLVLRFGLLATVSFSYFALLLLEATPSPDLFELVRRVCSARDALPGRDGSLRLPRVGGQQPLFAPGLDN